MRKVDIGAMRVFQERRLHEQGKVHVIEPAAVVERVGTTSRLEHVLARAVYAGCYYLGFGVALPAFYVASALGSKGNAMTRGLRGGATAATEDVDRLIARIRTAAEPAPSPSGAHAGLNAGISSRPIVTVGPRRGPWSQDPSAQP